MKQPNIPGVLYFAFKLLLMVTFLVPVWLWGGQMFGFSKAQEIALAVKSLQNTENLATSAEKYLKKEGAVLESRATADLERMEKKGKDLSLAAQRDPASKKQAASQAAADQTERAHGIDVSHYQGVVNWDRVARAGIHFGFVKATGGEHYVDPRFHENWHSMRAAEMYRGAYHFFYAAEDPLAQAKHFIATVRKLRPEDLPPVLDVEISDHTDKAKLISGTLIWLETVEKALGKRPMVYTDPGFGDQYLSDPRLSGYPLWIADYNKQVGSVPLPWKKEGWTFWQHSREGDVSGVTGKVDLNLFNGTLAELKKFIAINPER